MAAAHMNAPQKFLFERSFEAAGAPGAPRKPVKEPVKVFTEAELSQAREDGYTAGKLAAEHAAAQADERQIAQALATLTQKFAELGKVQAEAVERHGREAVHAALAVIRKLFPKLTQDHGIAEIEAVVAECLGQLREEPRVVIRVADPLLDAIQERVTAMAAQVGFEGKIVLLAQSDLQAGDVRVEWADGGAERDIGLLWREIDAIVERSIGAAPVTMGTATQTSVADASTEKHVLERVEPVSQ
jgi:flagellar assembly protein FliH